MVPVAIRTDDGRLHAGGVVVQRWIEGRPPQSATDWTAVASELRRLHTLTVDYRQRPGCCVVSELHLRRVSVDANLDAMPGDECALVCDVFAEFDGASTAVVHGDPGASNIRITESGEIGFLDWDESRVDVTWHDLSNLGIPVLEPHDHQRALTLSDAWEATNAWVPEPDYALMRFASLSQRRH